MSADEIMKAVEVIASCGDFLLDDESSSHRVLIFLFCGVGGRLRNGDGYRHRRTSTTTLCFMTKVFGDGTTMN